jgi:predicted SprT family Zn-dependent metalloprotease
MDTRGSENTTHHTANASNDVHAMDAALERAWLLQLQKTWNELNHAHFRGAMTPPALVLSHVATRLGLWKGVDRKIEISRKLCAERPWGMVVEVLKHEMAHQYVEEALKISDEAAHGPTFRALCERLGIDGSAMGMPAESEDSAENQAHAKLLQRISKLLALAESQNRHEAEAAMAAAQKLMLAHNIDTASAHRRGYVFKHLGAVKGRCLEPERRIAALLSAHFFVEVIWVHSFDPKTAKTGRVLEICGRPENLAMAEYVHGFLTHKSEQLWREHQKAHGTLGRERLAFLSGVIQGFAETLRQKQKLNAEQGLVWKGDVDLTKYYRARHPYVRMTRNKGASGNARGDGKAAGRGIILHRPMHAHGSGTTKLLGGRR